MPNDSATGCSLVITHISSFYVQNGISRGFKAHSQPGFEATLRQFNDGTRRSKRRKYASFPYRTSCDAL